MILWPILLLALLYAVLLVIANRRVMPISGEIPATTGPAGQGSADPKLSVLTWNIGYAGLGAEANLIADNGKSIRALSAPQIDRAAQGIEDRLGSSACDVICLQENANAGFLTRGNAVRQRIEARLPNRQNLFWSDMRTVLVPRFLKIDHGMSVHARPRLSSCQAETLPQDDIYHLGILKKHYGLLLCRFPIAGSDREWVVINLHLSAFDAGGRARQRQMDRLIQLAQGEYQRGHFVVIGGDWNMRLSRTAFAHQADPEHTGWMIDFPRDALPEGWKLAVYHSVPSVRSLNAAYVPGKNFRTIVDGFLCAPNVVVESVRTADLEFALSDHNPVEAHFEAKM